MISKSKLKYIKSLQIKKFRNENGQFLVEGSKSVIELLHSDFSVRSLFLTVDFYKCYKELIDSKTLSIEIGTERELSEAGSFVNNNSVIAIAEMKENKLLVPEKNEYLLILDDIRDPGNLGTILRTADWYGITKIICSETTAEFYNPKVISASMGSFCRIKIYYGNLNTFLSQHKTFLYGTRLEGENIHNINFEQEGMILIGNESSGISSELFPLIDKHLHIPSYGKAESLNAAIATAITCDNMRRTLSQP